MEDGEQGLFTKIMEILTEGFVLLTDRNNVQAPAEF